MKIVIDIEEELYNRILTAPKCVTDIDVFEDKVAFIKAIKDSTPFSKEYNDEEVEE